MAEKSRLQTMSYNLHNRPGPHTISSGTRACLQWGRACRRRPLIGATPLAAGIFPSLSEADQPRRGGAAQHHLGHPKRIDHAPHQRRKIDHIAGGQTQAHRPRTADLERACRLGQLCRVAGGDRCAGARRGGQTPLIGSEFISHQKYPCKARDRATFAEN